jgi:hypothetical protein
MSGSWGLRRTVVVLGSAVLALGLAAPGAVAATITVNTVADNAPSGTECMGVPGDCSLRQAIDKSASGDTINFASSLNGQTLTLTGGVLTIGKSLDISGPGASELTISGNHTSQIFSVTGGGSTGASDTISGLTLTDGMTSSGSGGAINAALNDSLGTNSLTLSDDVITGSHSTSTSTGAGGGGIQAFLTSSDSLTIAGSTISGNGAFNGAGLQQYGAGQVAITDSTFSDNTASIGTSLGSGGGALLEGMTTVTDSTFSGNSAATGGGVYVAASAGATFTGSTFSDNTATAPTNFNTSGGGMFVNTGTVSITNSTFTGNSATSTGGGTGYGGGIFRCCGAPAVNLLNDTIDANSAMGPGSTGGDVNSDNGTPAVSAENTIIADGTSATAGYQNCGESETSLGHNLSTGLCGFTSTGDKPGTAPDLAPLAANGGLTETMALRPGSPAIDAGSAAASCPTTDQRGDPRPDQGEPACDIGAYEFQDPAAAPVTLTVTKSGSGIVTSADGAINCGSTCSHAYPAGTKVTLTASPLPLNSFAGWSGGGCSGTSSCTLTLTANTSVNAAFTAVLPPPSCTLRASNTRVLLKKKGKHGKPGTIQLVARCSQAVTATIKGTVRAQTRKKGKKHTMSYRLSTLHRSLQANKSLKVTIKLPARALKALKAGAHESLTATLTAGSGRATVHVGRLRTRR